MWLPEPEFAFLSERAAASSSFAVQLMGECNIQQLHQKLVAVSACTLCSKHFCNAARRCPFVGTCCSFVCVAGVPTVMCAAAVMLRMMSQSVFPAVLSRKLCTFPLLSTLSRLSLWHPWCPDWCLVLTTIIHRADSCR
jgi:hypothetical protein